MSRQFAETFERRGTPVPAGEPIGLSDEFASDPERDTRWRAFLDRTDAAGTAPANLRDVVGEIRALVLAPLGAARTDSAS